MCFYVKILIRKCDIIWPDLGRRQSGWMTSWGQMIVTIDICLQNDPENICGTVCLRLLLYSDLLWPDLGLYPFKYALRTHAVPLVDMYPALWVSESSLHPV